MENKKNFEIRLLALISSAAVLRNYNKLKKYINDAVSSQIPSKKIYEALLQTYLFAGFPSALISLKMLQEIYPSRSVQTYEHDEYKLKQTGERNCSKIYGNKFEKLIYNVNSFSPELSEWLVIEGYGKVFSRKNLTLKERELLIVSVLSALKYESQLYSHINGAFRLKADERIIRSVITDLDKLQQGKSKFGIRVLEKYLKKRRGIKPP